MHSGELNQAQQIAFLAIQLGVIIIAARIFGDLARRIKLPSVLGELLAGILLGPFLLGQCALPLPGFEQGLFPLQAGAAVPVSPILYSLGTLGSIILLFMSGLETDLRVFFRYSVAGTLVGLGGLIASYLFGTLAGMLLLSAGASDPRCIFLGILCTATSVGVTARILSEHHAMDSPEGVTILAAAVIDDVAGIVCLAIATGIISVKVMGGNMAWGNIGLIAAKSFGIWLGVSLVGLLLAHRIAGMLKSIKQTAPMAVTALGMALLLAGFFEQAGLAMIVGAFVMGASLSKTDLSFKIRSTLTPIYALLVPVFFVVMGMLVDIRVLASPAVLKMGIIYSLIAVAAKICGCAIPALFLNFNWLGALRIGFGMVPRSEVALIIASIGATTMMRDASGKMVPIFDGALFGVAIIMTLITVLVAPPLLSAVLSIKRPGVKKERPDLGSVTSKFAFHSEVVASFMMRGIIEDFDNEGFLNSGFRKDLAFIQFRRREQIVSLRIQDDVFAFESSPDLVPLIKTIVYESLVELRHSVLKLQELARPDDLREEIFGNDKTMLSEAPAAISQGIDMARLLPADCIIVDLQADDKEGACRELLATINRSRPLLNPEQCFQDVMEREAVISTYQGDGIALPHGRTDGTRELRTAIGIRKNGLDFDAGEEHQVQIIVLSVCPREASEPYLQYIVNIAGVLSRPENRQAILAATDAAQVRRLFLGTRKSG